MMILSYFLDVITDPGGRFCVNIVKPLIVMQPTINILVSAIPCVRLRSMNTTNRSDSQ